MCILTILWQKGGTNERAALRLQRWIIHLILSISPSRGGLELCFVILIVLVILFKGISQKHLSIFSYKYFLKLSSHHNFLFRFIFCGGSNSLRIRRVAGFTRTSLPSVRRQARVVLLGRRAILARSLTVSLNPPRAYAHLQDPVHAVACISHSK